jgi:hypothetical protein
MIGVNASGLQEIRQVQHAPDVVPTGKAYGVITNGIEDALIALARTSRAVGGGRTVGQLIPKRRIAQRIMEPTGAQPALALSRRHLHCLGPLVEQRDHPFDVGPARR